MTAASVTVQSQPDLLTIDEVAARLRCSVKSIRRRVLDGRLHPVQAATNRLLFKRADVEALQAPDEPGQSSSTDQSNDSSRGTSVYGALAQDLAGLNS
ncbi:MAG: helix-turn-helix domain-containing protein [Planctomycetota bacterium]